MAQATGARPYLYELEPVRAVTALCVVGVHVVTGTVVFYNSSAGQELQTAVVTALHFTREIFLTLTAFVLVYGYAHKPFVWRTFWRKRGIGVLVPYVIWSLFYVWFAVPHRSVTAWLGSAAFDTVTGGASYQMYYILLTLEFYLVFPGFLWFLTRVGRHPWLVLGISFVVQISMVYVAYSYIQTGPLSATPFGHFANAVEDRFLLMYQFPIILGGMAALHLNQVRAFVLRYGRWTVLGLAVGLGVHWLHYWMAVGPSTRGMAYASSALQPTMVVYSLSVTLFLYWVASRWAARAEPGSWPRGRLFWLAVSNASFGIYLVHAFILTTLVLPHLAPLLPAAWPAPLRAGVVWLVVACSATIFSLGLLYVPGLSRLVGRACLLAPNTPPMRALAAARHAIQMLGDRKSARLVEQLPRNVGPSERAVRLDVRSAPSSTSSRS